MIKELIEKINNHSGEFLCEAIGAEENKKIVNFSHTIEPPEKANDIPHVGDIAEFYSLIGSLTLYYCPESDEAAYYLGHPTEWESFEEEFSDWLDMLDEDEEEEVLPPWFRSHKVIGEIPASGNFILLVTGGDESGVIYSFDHDGFEFKKLGSTIEEFILLALDPTPDYFSEIVTYMRFTLESDEHQWWARELRHNSGKIVRNND